MSTRNVLAGFPYARTVLLHELANSFKICRVFARSHGVRAYPWTCLQNALDPQLTVFSWHTVDHSRINAREPHTRQRHIHVLRYAPFSFLLKRPSNLPQLHCAHQSLVRSAYLRTAFSEAANQPLAAAGHSSRTAPVKLPFPAAFPVPCSCG
jgi:hypothetical protein